MYFRPGPEVLWGGVQKFCGKNRNETKISLEINGTFLHFEFDLESPEMI